MDMESEQWEVVANKEFEWSGLFVILILDTISCHGDVQKSMGRRRMSETNLNASMSSIVTMSKNPKWQSESDNIEKYAEVDG
ncbi:unnamed protein product [Auanema sp. JU1783]|nr:unnamed protein product [Auanema sp. JU1783]